MKKSRKNFIFALVMVAVAAIGATVGGFIGSSATKWMSLAALIVLAISALIRFSSSKPIWQVDMALILAIGGVIGTLRIISHWHTMLIAIVIGLMLAVIAYIYTGCTEE